MKKNQKNKKMLIKFACTAAVVLSGLTSCMASQVTQGDPAAIIQSIGPQCVGTYYAVAKMTNGSGTFWLTPPAGTTNGVFKDVSGLPSPYLSATMVGRRSDQMTWCTNSTNGVSFPASSSTTYSMTAYVNSKTPALTNGQPLKLQITWQ